MASTQVNPTRMELTRQKIKAIDNQNKEEKTANEAAENKN